MAFLIAVVVSYLGNYHWTFRAQSRHRSTFPRFIGTALFGLALSQSGLYVLVFLLDLPGLMAISLIVIVTPVLTYTLNRLLVF